MTERDSDGEDGSRQQGLPSSTHALCCFSNFLQFFKVHQVFLIDKVHHSLTLGEGGGGLSEEYLQETVLMQVRKVVPEQITYIT